MPVAPEPSPSSSSTHGGGGGGGGEKKVILSKYEVGKLLGCGAFAKVYHARHSATSNSVAIKCISKQKILKNGLSANIKREISIMRRLRHPHIVRPLEVLASRHRIYFVMEFAKGGELFSRLASNGRFSEDLSRRYFRQLVSAVGYCHARGVFHRDLKPENLLLDENGDLKVSDFGLSAVADQLPADDSLFHTLCGTPAYVAPEILAKKGYDGAKVDVWSCGVILFVLVAGYLPFNDPNLMSMYRKIYRGDYRCPKWIPPDLKRLLSRLLDTDPKTRISIEGILNDPWFNKGIGDADRAELARFHHHEDASLKLVKEMDDRELNAFDIISFSSGFDLSGMFEAAKRRERFACRATPEGAIARLEEEVGRGGEGLEVKRRGEKGTGLVVEDASGFVLVAVEVYRLNREMVVVEIADSGRGSEALWERLRSTLDRLARQTGLVAGS